MKLSYDSRKMVTHAYVAATFDKTIACKICTL